MNTLIRGQKIDLTKNNPSLSNISIDFEWFINSTENFDTNIMAISLDSSGKISDKNQIVYYNQKKSSNNSISISTEKKMKLTLHDLPITTNKVLIVLDIYEAINKKQNFNQFKEIFAIIKNDLTNSELYRYNLEVDFNKNSTLVVGEIYRHNGEWKFSAVGRGVNGGLGNLLLQYGFAMNQKDFLKTSNNDVNNNQSTYNKNSKISLSKIELKKSGDSIDLSKVDDKLGKLNVNLNWNQNGNSNVNKGFFSSLFSSTSVDLDLGCLYELNDGEKGVVQALGNMFGSFNNRPYIKLDQDDRSGNSLNGENLNINGKEYSKFKRILIFAYIYDGAANWSEVDGVVKVKQIEGPDIIVKLDNHSNNKNMCAIAMIERTKNNTLKITKLSKYYSGHKELDRAYDWNMRWTAGSK
ncbi:TerD family protein [Exiguobacterium artemiae]|uniref:TerD family protein n=1 Tax=Exiguobacterium artemiae TaxID=340145 RepID=UPI002963E80E|nr:TerD family protein [Exiguobacterium sibiricum]MDW2884626.1 TerD family protein [Exiguobacterium sibiricum]